MGYESTTWSLCDVAIACGRQYNGLVILPTDPTLLVIPTRSEESAFRRRRQKADSSALRFSE
jgi:hypothetical protein